MRGRDPSSEVVTVAFGDASSWKRPAFKFFVHRGRLVQPTAAQFFLLAPSWHYLGHQFDRGYLFFLDSAPPYAVAKHKPVVLVDDWPIERGGEAGVQSVRREGVLL